MNTMSYLLSLKLTKKQILELHQALASVGSLRGAMFAYSVAKNMHVLEPEVLAIQKAYVPPKEFNVYEGERVALAESHAEKVDGKPQTKKVDGVDSYDIKDKEKFLVELKALQAKHEPAIKAREQQVKDVERILEETVDVSLFTITPGELPSDISVEQTKELIMIIDEGKKDEKKAVN